MALLYSRIVDAQGTQAPSAGNVNRRPSRWRRHASKAASGKGPEPLAHRAHHASSLLAPLFASSETDYSALSDKAGDCLLVVIVSRYTADCLGLTLVRAVDLGESNNDTFPQGSEYLIILRLIMRHCDHGTF